MEREPPPVCVEYSHGESSVNFLENNVATSTANHKHGLLERKFSRRHSLKIIAKVLIPVSLIIAGPALTYFILYKGEKVASAGLQASFSAPPDVVNLSLVSTSTSSFAVTWKRPEGHFDYYSIEVAAANGNSRDPYEVNYEGSCANFTIIHPDQTKVTCTHVAGCTYLNFTLRTSSNSPSKETSTGVTLHGIFIPGPEPDPPKGIGITGISPSISKLHWEPQGNVAGTFNKYIVKVCDTFTLCDEAERLIGCIENQTAQTWLEFESKSDTTYCVLVTTSSVCGELVLRSRPAAVVIKTPLLALADVVNLSLVVSGEDFFTVSWVRPHVRFDYYIIEVEQQSANGSERVKALRAGSCFSGDIILPKRTQVTCSRIESCTKWTFKLLTHSNGPPVLTSMGAILTDIVILDQEPSPPTHMNVVALSPSKTRLYWDVPEKASANITSYAVNICDTLTKCDGERNVSACTERQTPNGWLDFNSMADTSYCVIVRSNPRCWADVRKRRSATAVYRVPYYEPPAATNLSLQEVAAGNFVVNWQQPRGYFDYYLLEVVVEKNGTIGIENQTTGTCATGTLLPANETRVTCDELEECTKANITLRTVVKGPSERTSTGVSIDGIFIPGKAGPPDVIDLKLEARGTDFFTVTWVRPEGCFQSYLVEFVDQVIRDTNDVQQTFGTCSNTSVDRYQTSITCSNVQACSAITVQVRTFVSGPPDRTSTGVMIRDLVFPGAGIEDFYLYGEYNQVAHHATIKITLGGKMTPCLRNICYGELKCEHLPPAHFSCQSQNNGIIYVYLNSTPFDIQNRCLVTLINPQIGKTSTQEVSFQPH